MLVLIVPHFSSYENYFFETIVDYLDGVLKSRYNGGKGGVSMPSREKNVEKEDLRRRRSKRYLSEALFSLMEERPLRDISVVDICERAMVHRTTFYAHFEDKMDLFRYVLEEMLRAASQTRDDVAEEKGIQAGVMAEFRMGLDFFRQHKKFYLSGLSGGVGPELRTVETAVAEAVESLILAKCPQEEPRIAQAVGAFYAGAMLGILRWWLESDMAVSEEKLVALAGELLPKRYQNA